MKHPMTNLTDMKTNIFNLALLFVTTFCFGQTTIQMTKVSGVYEMPCTVNGLKLKFIFDSGASDVCISD
jgi:predicted aspartyl protease